MEIKLLILLYDCSILGNLWKYSIFTFSPYTLSVSGNTFSMYEELGNLVAGRELISFD